MSPLWHLEFGGDSRSGGNLWRHDVMFHHLENVRDVNMNFRKHHC
jgi:hypothetical protein